ncbi:MAG: F0F1 ATP synthase subunit delta [Porphyromonadaceae bacterium]|nr:F0F1 ATP synthase subunit delta [Porphyromonadaceae bacterium]
MNEGLIASRYAKALLKYAQEREQSQSVYEAAQRVEANFAARPDLQEILLNPVLEAGRKEAIMLSAAGVDASSSEEYLRFVRLLLRARRESYLRPIMLMYQKMYRDFHHIVKVHVTTAAPLDKKNQARIETIVSRHCADAVLEFEYRVDPEIIGGFVLRVGGELFDASIEKELKQLRLKLINSKTRI